LIASRARRDDVDAVVGGALRFEETPECSSQFRPVRGGLAQQFRGAAMVRPAVYLLQADGADRVGRRDAGEHRKCCCHGGHLRTAQLCRGQFRDLDVRPRGP
jgi:hypothetical protein